MFLSRLHWNTLLSLLRGLKSRVPNKGRYRSWNVGSSEERHDGNHGKTAVVELRGSLFLESLSVNSGEVNRREYYGRKVSSLGVVGLLGLSYHLGDEYGGKNLGLSGIRNGCPLFKGLQGGERLEGDIVAEVSWEVNSGSLYQVTNSGKHSRTAVFELRGAEPGEGLFASKVGKTDGVEVLDRGTASWHAIKRYFEGSGRANLDWRVKKKKKNVIECFTSLLFLSPYEIRPILSEHKQIYLHP